VRTFLLLQIAAACIGSTAFSAEETDQRTAKGIQDNSFLVEEAYNQEAGVVQHILNIRHELNILPGENDKEWQFVFTQEWPLFSQTHQVSYTVPYSFLESGGQSANGFGDVLLNYRFQALYESDTLPAFAPRFSLVLPTGDESKGLGDNTLGYQFNLPMSKIVQDRWTLHANAGLTFFPDLNGRNPLSYNLGGSAIYAVSRNFNLMLETIGEWNETVDARGGIDRDFEALISPGARYALNLPAGQLVLGIGVPIGLTKAAPDYGVFLYFSFEHRFKK
jgi:Putative MetA-pathway of phenol degradation